MSALTASASFFGNDLGSDRGRGGCKGFRVARGCNGYFDALAGKRLGKSVADLAEADNCVAHNVLRSCVALGSDLSHAAIDGEIHAGDVRTFIGGEERDGSRDFLWLAPATHRDL